jgi:EpsI family protein
MGGCVRKWLPIAAPLLLAAQAAFVGYSGGAERPPAPPDLSRFPGGVGKWTQSTEDPIGNDVLSVLMADRVLSRVYVDPAGGPQVGVFVAWFQSQRGGQKQPHSPKVCLPGSGWEPRGTGDIELQTRSGSITASRMLVAYRSDESVILYWYQTPRHVISGEWAAKFWLVADALRDRRTDTALVRINVSAVGFGAARADAAAREFAKEVYPLLRSALPR